MPSASAIAVLHGARSFDGAVSGTECPHLCRRLPSWATRQVGGYLGYTGRTANVVARSDAFTWPHATRLQSAWHPRNREALGRFLQAVATPHCRVSSLEMTYQTRSVKQRISFLITGQLGPGPRDPASIAGECDRGHFVVVEGVRYEFGQADRVEQTRAHAPSERVTSARKHRKACPEGVADGRAAVERKRIEKKVCGAIAGKIISVRDARCEDKTRRIDPVTGRFTAQIILDRCSSAE